MANNLRQHRLDSFEYIFVFQGELKVLTPAASFKEGGVLEDNVQVTIVKPGDLYVQRGTMHG